MARTTQLLAKIAVLVYPLSERIGFAGDARSGLGALSESADTPPRQRHSDRDIADAAARNPLRCAGLR